MSRLLKNLPRLSPGPEQTITGVGPMLTAGRVACIDLLDACLEQVEEWEPKVHAWVVIDRDGAREQARALDEELRSGRTRGSLHGIPVGIKDIIDVKGLPTTWGARRWADGIAEEDADVVSRLREAGAVIVGKTVTTPYAWIDPPPTRNPWSLDRTPGGSSSGSAAAVACGMCYGAVGSQTGGSITRPASYCGVAGMKPGFDEVSTRGVLPLAPSLDHVGPIARCVTDLFLLFDVVSKSSADTAEKLRQSIAAAPRRGSSPRLGRLRGFFDRRLDAPIRPLIDDAMRALGDRGAEIVDVEDPVDFDAILAHHRTIMAAEAGLIHFERLRRSPDDYPPRIRELIEEGLMVSRSAYEQAKTAREVALGEFPSLGAHEGVDAFVTPAAVGTAPDPSTTGDPAFNSPWSFLGLPTVSFPVGRAPDRLPVALQLVGTHSLPLLRAAMWCEDAIRHRDPR